MLIEIFKDNILPVFIITAVVFSFATYYFFKAKSGDTVQIGESTQTFFQVDVSGAVEKPGIYELPENSRVADLLREAGGVTNEVSKEWVAGNINVSEILSDEQKVHVPFEWELQDYKSTKAYYVVNAPDESVPNVKNTDISGVSSGAQASSSGSGTSDLININTASLEDLKTLPRIGEVTAEKIITNRPYSDLADLKDKASIYDSVIDQIQSLITF